MTRAFTAADNEHRFHHRRTGAVGTLEFPLIDPGPMEEWGILWLDHPWQDFDWLYVHPTDVEPDEAAAVAS